MDPIVPTGAPRTSGGIRVRLSVMMFLQYFIQGSYLPVASVYVQDALGFSEIQVGLFGSALAVGPLFAPFIIGQLVDRHWATERVLAISHLLGGATMLLLYFETRVTPFVILGTIYSILYIPTMMLTNSLAFHHLKDRDNEFPRIRLFGTIGFVVPAWCVEYFWLSGLDGAELNTARGIVLAFAGTFGLLMAAYCWTLPATPPERKKGTAFAPAKVFELLGIRAFLVLVIISFFVAIVHKFYFVLNSPFLKDILRSGGVKGAWEQRISSIGQISEVLIMVGLGWSIRTLGFKRTLAAGIFAYMLRCAVFATAISLEISFPIRMTMILFGQALHGVCFACFLAAAFMFVDRISTRDIRGSMQNLYGTFLIGVGGIVGGIASGLANDWFTTKPGETTFRQILSLKSKAGVVISEKNPGWDFKSEFAIRDWTSLWGSCGILALFCLIAFWLSFPTEPPPEADPAEEADDNRA